MDELRKLKMGRTDFFYPTLKTYEDPMQGVTELNTKRKNKKKRKKRVDWQNECLAIERKGPMVDRVPWGDAENKVKSLIYLSLGTEATRIFHQRNPHTHKKTEVQQPNWFMKLTITPKNITFDRFHFFNTTQQSNQSLETYYNRLIQLGSHCGFRDLSGRRYCQRPIYTQNENSNIQIELLSEVRSPAQILIYFINRERC